MRTWALLSILAVLTPLAASAATAGDGEELRKRWWPKSYDEFATLAANRRLTAEDLGAYNYLPPGKYTIDNPLVITGREAVFLHGIDRMETSLVPLNRGQPLLIVRNNAYISIAGLRFTGFRGRDGVNLRVEGDGEQMLDVQDSFFEGGSVELEAPGNTRLQGNFFNGLARVGAQIVQDHPDSTLTIVGGNITNSGVDGGSDIRSYAHVWTRSGLLKIVGTGVQRTRGLADFRIDSAPPVGYEHQIINVRSEGERGLVGKPSAFVFVPPTTDQVDISIVNSAGAWDVSGEGRSFFANYAGQGRLRLIGNSSDRGVGRAVNFSAGQRFKAVGIANTTRAPWRPSEDLESSRLIFSHERYAAKHDNPVPGQRAYKEIEAIGDSQALFDNDPLDIAIPEPLVRPRFNSAPEGMRSVIDFGAVANDEVDDSPAFAKAFRASNRIYIPAGDYRLGEPIRWNDSKRGRIHPVGGALIGHGSQTTRLIGSGGTLFSTQGLAYAHIQGLRFVDRSAGATVVSLENDPKIGHATQSNHFYDIAIEGGQTALGLGQLSRQQCSENLFVDFTVRDANTAVSVGSFNALANIFYRVSIAQTATAFGQHGKLKGGSWTVLNGAFSNISKEIFRIQAASNGIWFAHGLQAKNTTLIRSGANGAPINLFVNQSDLEAIAIDYRAGGGVILNRSWAKPLVATLRAPHADAYLINIDSETDMRLPTDLDDRFAIENY
ncbi:MAG: glycosyl hydrolase family 28-related protein [Pseudomonadota bacterium]